MGEFFFFTDTVFLRVKKKKRMFAKIWCTNFHPSSFHSIVDTKQCINNFGIAEKILPRFSGVNVIVQNYT